MTDEDHRPLYERVATLEEKAKAQEKELASIRNRVWTVLVGVAVWAFNFISKKVGL